MLKTDVFVWLTVNCAAAYSVLTIILIFCSSSKALLFIKLRIDQILNQITRNNVTQPMAFNTTIFNTFKESFHKE